MQLLFVSLTTKIISSSIAVLDAEHSESDAEEGGVDQPVGISAKRSGGKGSKRKNQKKKDVDAAASDEPSTVIYLGHLPDGFEEREMTVFLNQFGPVRRCRVSRSTKTGRSRGYAFVQFADPEVTKIVAETMSGYFLLEKRLVCHVLPMDKVHELMFAKSRRVPTKADKQRKAREEQNGALNRAARSVEVLKGITAKLVKREEKKRKKLADLGIDYDFPGYAGCITSSDVAESGRKKRKVSEDESHKQTDAVEEATQDNAIASKTPKSKKKKKRKSSIGGAGDAEESVEEKENGNANDAPVEDSSSKTKKKSSKTPKRAKTPKK